MNKFVRYGWEGTYTNCVADLGEDVGWRSGSESRYDELSFKKRQRRNKKGFKGECFLAVAAMLLFVSHIADFSVKGYISL